MKQARLFLQISGLLILIINCVGLQIRRNDAIDIYKYRIYGLLFFI